MNQLDAITTLLEVTVEMDDQPLVRRARKVLAKKADKLRQKRARRLGLEVVPEPLPATVVDCPKCGTAGAWKGTSTNQNRWVEFLECPLCGTRWEKLVGEGVLRIPVVKGHL